MFNLRVIVEDVRGFCDLPLVPGDYFEVCGGRITIPEGKFMCMWAMASLLPMLPAKQRKILEKNDWLSDVQHICCPDPNGQVVFRIERISEGEVSLSNSSVLREKTPLRLMVNSSLCTGCRSCEMACSFAHTSSFSFNDSRIRIEKTEEDGQDIPLVCRQCDNSRCLEVCAPGALERDPVSRALCFNPKLCDKCHKCVEACAFCAVNVHPDSGHPLFCDLCGGDPACVERCPSGALVYGRVGEPPHKGGVRAAMK